MTSNSVGIDKIANACKDVVHRELKMQFESAYRIENEKLMRNFINRRNRNVRMVTADPRHEKIFGEGKSAENAQLKNNVEYRERPLLFWRNLDRKKIDLMNQLLGPRNIWEEQIEWTKKGKMWPYPIDNEYLLGEEGNVNFIDHVFLKTELAKYDLPKSKAVKHFMELVLIGLSKNPYMSVDKKHEHIRWFVDYFNDVSKSGKYKEILDK